MTHNFRPQFIDCHAHLNFSAYDSDREEVLKRTLEGNTWIVNVGTKQKTSENAVALAENREGVYAIIGLHPIHVNPSFHDKEELGGEGEPFKSKGEDFDFEFYKKLASHPKVVAIGECGLDYYRLKIEDSKFGDFEKKRQEYAFRKQIELAIEIDKPLMIHCRNAYRETLDILSSYFKIHGSRLRGNFHFFAGTIEEEKEILDLGFNVSFTGVITFAQDYEEKIKFAPLDRILSETDCPYVSPAPHRGKRNEPLYVKHVALAIARIKNEDASKIQNQLVENAFKLFKL